MTTKKKKTGTTRARKPVAPVATVEPDLSRPVRPYRVSDTYDVGDRIDHGSFGTGVVERIAGPKKVQVFFEEGPKTLMQGRTSD